MNLYYPKNSSRCGEDNLQEMGNMPMGMLPTGDTPADSLPVLKSAQMPGNIPDNMRGNMPDNMRGNMRGNMPGNMRGNMPGSIPGNMRGNMPSNMRGSIPGNMPGSMPSSPPPSFIPQRNAQSRIVDAASIRNCLYRFTYVWQMNGDAYWMFPIRVSRTTVSGFRWSNRLRWGFFGVSLRQIASFMCN